MLKHYKLKLEDNDKDSSLEESKDEQVQCQKVALNSLNDFARIDGDHLEILMKLNLEFCLVLLQLLQLTQIVQGQEPWQNMYPGTGIGKGSYVHFDMVHLKKIPPHCKYLFEV
ncbi:uncharacterized protein LOC143154345 isoform X2 [Ptiloglossa arizonensis]|uniref:uncharacterized protein LOC143154345 isoform X2 n=1 Tax=Ptiloglossa arizonensis TaxID=3350558 RepID=UPI003FA12199